jgi:ribosomal-protein-alanine N-acetyltransferase
MNILETERLIVRHLRADDLDEMYAICSDPELMRMVGDGQPLAKESVRRWIEKSLDNYSRRGFGCSAVISKSDDSFIGFCGLVCAPGSDEPEIIYVLKKEYWGQGMATEVARAMIDYGFTKHKLKRIIATIDPENFASIKIVEKIGMKFEQQRLDENNLPEGVYVIERTEGL